VKKIYDRLHTEYGMNLIKPPALSLVASHLEFKRLEEKAEIFRSSAATMMTEQHFVIKKFFITLASQARQTFHECNESARNWFKVAVSPVFTHVQQHRAAIERKLEILKNIQQDIDSLNEQTSTLARERQDLESQLNTARQLLERIQKPFH
jgi:peptidoglycan hydrolase CwlO-like protein